MFPLIRHINDVLPHIEDNDNFYVNHKEDGVTVIDYILNTPDSFLNPYQKECRGLLFYKDGTIMSRRLHKFFNINEREESLIENLDLSKPHWILEKLDGSMITHVFSNGKWTWGSKAGVTFLTPQIEEFVSKNNRYRIFMEDMVDMKYISLTPIFEWCTRKNRIVIDYPVDRLVLIALRDNITGQYADYNELVNIGEIYGIEVVKQYEGSVANMQQLHETVKGMSGIEGFVIRFADGHMVKMKCDEYCMYHKAKDDFIREKNIISMIVNNQVDDFLPLLQKEDRQKLLEFCQNFNDEINKSVSDIIEMFMNIKASKMTRKEFALSEMGQSKFRSFIFKFFDDPVVGLSVLLKKEIYKTIGQSCGSASKVDAVRGLWGNLHWSEYLNPQDLITS